jgi:hypothetical protein
VLSEHISGNLLYIAGTVLLLSVCRLLGHR